MNNKSINICIVNYKRDELLFNCIKTLNHAVKNYSCALFVVDFDRDVKLNMEFHHMLAGIWGSFLMTYPVNEHQFSLGKGRNIALARSTGDVLAFIDADMLLPSNFFDVIIPQIEQGKTCFPLYKRYTGREHKALSDGNGYGNVVISRDNVNKLLILGNGQLWPEFTTWGGEDTKIVKMIRENNMLLWREYIDGFYHQWHAKDTEFYKKEK